MIFSQHGTQHGIFSKWNFLNRELFLNFSEFSPPGKKASTTHQNPFNVFEFPKYGQKYVRIPHRILEFQEYVHRWKYTYKIFRISRIRHSWQTWNFQNTVKSQPERIPHNA